MRKHYILTKPEHREDLTEVVENNIITEADFRWLEKSRKLQARRWRRIKHQLA